MRQGPKPWCCCGVLLLAGLLATDIPTAGAQTNPPSRQTDAEAIDASEALNAREGTAAAKGVIFGDVVGPVFGDFRRLPSRDTLTWLGIGGAVALSARPADRPTSTGMAGSQVLDGVFEAGEAMGGAASQFTSAAATYLAGRATNNPGVTAVGADLLRAQIVAQTLTAGIKLAVRRERPDGALYSFPSGHASVSFASATVLERHYGWRLGIPAYAVATYVATSRIQEERHFLSDIAFGAVVGIVAGRTVTIGLGEHRFAVTPTVVPVGAGVSLSLATSR